VTPRHRYAVTARPHAGYRGRAHGLTPPRPRDCPCTRSRRPGRAVPIHVARMRALSSSQRPMHLPLPRICSGAAQSRLPRLPLPPAGARRCAPWFVAPTRVRAPRKPPPTPLERSRARALAGRLACTPALRPPRPTAASLAADRRRSRFPPSQLRQSREGESKPHPSRLLAGVRPSLAAGRPCATAGDVLAKIEIFPGACV
jgi:hypothetical protein